MHTFTARRPSARSCFAGAERDETTEGRPLSEHWTPLTSHGGYRHIQQLREDAGEGRARVTDAVWLEESQFLLCSQRQISAGKGERHAADGGHSVCIANEGVATACEVGHFPPEANNAGQTPAVEEAVACQMNWTRQSRSQSRKRLLRSARWTRTDSVDCLLVDHASCIEVYSKRQPKT